MPPPHPRQRRHAAQRGAPNAAAEATLTQRRTEPGVRLARAGEHRAAGAGPSTRAPLPQRLRGAAVTEVSLHIGAEAARPCRAALVCAAPRAAWLSSALSGSGPRLWMLLSQEPRLNLMLLSQEHLSARLLLGPEHHLNRMPAATSPEAPVQAQPVKPPQSTRPQPSRRHQWPAGTRRRRAPGAGASALEGPLIVTEVSRLRHLRHLRLIFRPRCTTRARSTL